MKNENISWIFNNNSQEIELTYSIEDNDWEYSNDYEFFSLQFKDNKWNFCHEIPVKNLIEEKSINGNFEDEILNFSMKYDNFEIKKVIVEEV